VGDIRKAWAKACRAAGMPGLLFHDLRRSAVRNLDRNGISQSVAMAITGHITTSIYQRYRIINEDDLAAAPERVQVGVAQGARKIVPAKLVTA
jgi:integrase